MSGEDLDIFESGRLTTDDYGVSEMANRFFGYAEHKGFITGLNEEDLESLRQDEVLELIFSHFVKYSKEPGMDEFLRFMNRHYEGFNLAEHLKTQHSNIVKLYGADIDPGDRENEVELSEEEILQGYKFQLMRYDVTHEDFDNEAEDFKNDLIKITYDYPFVTRGDQIEQHPDLNPERAKFIRRGVLKHFDYIFEENGTTNEYERDRILDYIDQFITYYGRPDTNNKILDLRNHRSRQETVWFLQRVGVPRAHQVGFTTEALFVTDRYGDDKIRKHPPKHPNDPENEGVAAPFEHFMSVTRLALGALDGLQNNAQFNNIPLLNHIEKRPHYQTEIAYTAYLHDALEEGKMTRADVREFLSDRCQLPDHLVEQIFTNLDLLNNRRLDPETGEQIKLEKYVDGILESRNPVVLLVKYADIMHNAKSPTPGKYGENGQLAQKWIDKHTLYNRIVGRILQEPVYIAQKEPRGALCANPELLRFSHWEEMLDTRPDKSEILQTCWDHFSEKITARAGVLGLVK